MLRLPTNRLSNVKTKSLVHIRKWYFGFWSLCSDNCCPEHKYVLKLLRKTRIKIYYLSEYTDDKNYLGVCWRTPKFKLPLLAEGGLTTSSLPPLVPLVTGNTWQSKNCKLLFLKELVPISTELKPWPRTRNSHVVFFAVKRLQDYQFIPIYWSPETIMKIMMIQTKK